MSETFEIVGDRQAGPALTGTPKLRAELTATLAAGMFSGGWAIDGNTLSLALSAARDIIEGEQK